MTDKASAARVRELAPGQDPVEAVIQRVWRKYENEVASTRVCPPEERRERVGNWLAGVSFDEWFALVDAYRDAQSV